jgi:hypothetical protein
MFFDYKPQNLLGTERFFESIFQKLSPVTLKQLDDLIDSLEVPWMFYTFIASYDAFVKLHQRN